MWVVYFPPIYFWDTTPVQNVLEPWQKIFSQPRYFEIEYTSCLYQLSYSLLSTLIYIYDLLNIHRPETTQWDIPEKYIHTYILCMHYVCTCINFNFNFNLNFNLNIYINYENI